MRKLFLCISILSTFGTAAYAQNCSTGFCPATVIAHHKIGAVAPVSADITYNVISTNAFGSATGGYCLLDRNLGVTTLPTTVSDYTNGTGWVFQFGKAKGWTASTISSNLATFNLAAATGTSWTAANDPCTILLGSSWRIPTKTEWTAAIGSNTPTSLYATWKTCLTCGYLQTTGALWSCTYATVNSSTSDGTNYYTFNATSATSTYTVSTIGPHNMAMPVRCIKNFAN